MDSRPNPFKAPATFAPTVPALPGLPLLGNFLEFRRDQLGLHAHAARRGPITRFQLGKFPIYSISDAGLAHEILVDNAAAFRKSAGLQFMVPVLGNGLLTAEGDLHKRHRKLLAPAFAPKRLAAYGDLMVAETVNQVRRWRAEQQIDISTEMMHLTLAIVGKTMFGSDVRLVASTIGDGLELAMRSVMANFTTPIPVGYHWPLPRHRKMRRAVKMLDDVVYTLIAEGRAHGTDRGDVLSMLLLAADDDGGPGLSDRQIRDEVMTLLLAGHETTANALTWTWYELARNRDALHRLETELAEVLGDRPATVEDLPALPWNLAVIEEAMRLHSPVYETGREALRDVTIGGHVIPGGSTMVINLRGIHRRPDYYPAPLAFRPERMLPAEKKLRPRHHYLPFGAGPRVCIGAHFAMLEAQLALATMVQQVRLIPLVGNVDPEPLITLRPRGGLPAIVERR
ncbi:MAG: cytochrome P450 [Kofleriaceae bacterium]